MANERIIQHIGMSSFLIFAFNHRQGWIDEVWDGHMRDHLKEKWNGYCADAGYGSADAVLRFIASLDQDNRRLLFDYILKNY